MISTIKYNIQDVSEYIDWSYFFHAWGFSIKFSALTEVHNCQACVNEWIKSFKDDSDCKRAEEAYNLYCDAVKLLDEFSNEYHTYGRIAIFDAVGDGDDIIVYDSDGMATTIPCLRQQMPNSQNVCLCLADFLRPKGYGDKDKMGIFAASVDGEMEKRFADDDYKHLLCQTLADRLAEATAELLHMQTRREYWGYAKDERLTVKEILSCKYRGIRPAIGYPPLPDQSVIFIIDKLVDLSQIGISLTESGAMLPHSSTCGLMFAHPQSQYFAVGAIGADQMSDYAKRRGISTEKISRFLASNLNK